MGYQEVKIYRDGYHYVGIPYKPNPSAKKSGGNKDTEADEKKKAFETAYKGTKAKGKKKRTKELIAEFRPQFETEEQTAEFVRAETERMERNRIARKIRLQRKIDLGEWDYFCTFTYDDKKHTEESFRRKLSDTFKKLRQRYGWEYLGVYERSPKNDRLHFHGLFYTPKMIGELVKKRDYSTKEHRMQTTLQNTYFTKRFGRNDFEQIDTIDLATTASYLMKYIEKSGERIVCSKGVKTYFISDIIDDDVVCTIGNEDRKILLFDDFSCFDEGVYVGEASRETIKQMRKTN
jgi:hypothetical protein